LTADLRFAESSTRLIIKQMPDKSRGTTGRNICQIHDRISHYSKVLSVSTPAFYGYHEQAGCVAMEFIPGSTLLDVLESALSRRSAIEYNGDCLLERSAAVLAEFHRLTPACAGIDDATRSNASYVNAFLRLLNNPVMKSTLRSVRHHLLRAIESVDSSFLSRIDNRLLVRDSQPKNILVPEPGRVCFIDLDFISGPPAMNLALFVTAFDRLSTRYFSPQAKTKINLWKQAFISHYLRHSDCSGIVNDFHFFHLWALVMTMRRHVGGRKWLRAYLSRRYLQQIESVLENNTNGLYSLNATT
jgi:hypothetical protein